jgi:hypothetical protein
VAAELPGEHPADPWYVVSARRLEEDLAAADIELDAAALEALASAVTQKKQLISMAGI